jgi:hypothetical protein
MGKKISQITTEETSALSDTDVFEGEETGGTSFRYLFSVLKSTLKTYFDAIYAAISIVESSITLADNTTNDASTSKHGFLPKLDNSATNFLNGKGAWVAPAGSGGGKYPAFVRCSVVSGDPFPAADYLAQTAIYAVLTQGDTYPQWNGSDFAAQDFTEQTLTLNAAHTANSIYDIYLWLDGATQRIVTGPAWASAASRGTGASTAETEVLQGVTVNKVEMTVRNGANTYTMPARYGTVIGTFVASANGQVEWSVKYRGIYNFYNQKIVPVHICPGYNDDNSVTSYTFNSATWVEANGGTGSKIKFVLGEPRAVEFLIKCRAGPVSAGYVLAAVGIDTITSPKTPVVSTLAGTNVSEFVTTDNNVGLPLAIGSHYASCLVSCNTTGTNTVYADSGRSGGSAADTRMTYVNGTIMM